MSSDKSHRFLLAGHETTSTGTTWCLYALTQAPHIQQKLRLELLSVPTDTPTMDELMALPYLDMVVRETLRLHPPVPLTIRTSGKEQVIPVDEPFVDRFGNIQNQIRSVTLYRQEVREVITNSQGRKRRSCGYTHCLYESRQSFLGRGRD